MVNILYVTSSHDNVTAAEWLYNQMYYLSLRFFHCNEIKVAFNPYNLSGTNKKIFFKTSSIRTICYNSVTLY
jgi:4-alpha-glucanotransferase